MMISLQFDQLLQTIALIVVVTCYLIDFANRHLLNKIIIYILKYIQYFIFITLKIIFLYYLYSYIIFILHIYVILLIFFINDKCKIFYLVLVYKPGVVPPLRFDPGAGGLFITSLIRRQLSSSLSPFASYM